MRLISFKWWKRHIGFNFPTVDKCVEANAAVTLDHEAKPKPPIGLAAFWRLVAFAASEIAEHAVGGLSQIVVGVYVWKWDSVWEPVDNEDIPALGSGWDVTFVAAVVVEGWTHVPAVDTMWSHVGLLRWSGVCDGSGSWQGEGCAQEIEGLVEQGVGR